ncbi:uncharacterized protein LOC100180798 [Ciona intestinalis]
MRDNASNICTGNVRCFCAERSPFYWRKLNAKSATKMLINRPVGSYLLRPSEHPLYDYSITQKIPVMGVTHIRVGRDSTGTYFLDNDDSFSEAVIKGFTCVVSMLDCWSRVYRERGMRCLQSPVRQRDVEGVVCYVNDDSSSVCFHDDTEAEESVRNFVTSFIKKGLHSQTNASNTALDKSKERTFIETKS